jgi:hypothetical protein
MCKNVYFGRGKNDEISNHKISDYFNSNVKNSKYIELDGAHLSFLIYIEQYLNFIFNSENDIQL